MTDIPTSYTIQPPETKKNKTAIIIVIVFVVLALVGSFLFFRQTQDKGQAENSVLENNTPTPTPTEEPKVDKKSVKIQVLNGTGTPGQAADAVEALEKAGYDADNIKTGNAEEFDHKNTTVSYKDGFKDTADDIKKALGSAFDDIVIDSTLLDEDSEFDIVVTTGGKIFEEETTTLTPKPTLTSSSPTPSPTTATTTLTPTLTSTPSPTPTP